MLKKRLTISLNEDDHEALSKMAEVEERSLSWVVNQAVKHFLSGKGIQQSFSIKTMEHGSKGHPRTQ